MHRLLTAGLLLLTGPAVAAGQDPDALVGRYGVNAPAELYFITAPQLSRLDRLSSTQAKGLSYLPSKVLSDARRAKAIFQTEGCTNASSPEWGLAQIPADPVAFIFRTSPISFVGRVVKITPGWLPSKGSPKGSVGTMFTIVVTEIMKDDSKSLKPGARVTVNRLGGEFTFEGTVFCTRNPYVSPVSVDQLLIVATSPSEMNGPRTFDTGFLMRLEGDMAIPLQKQPTARGFEPRALIDLKRAAVTQPDKGEQQ